MRCPLLGSAALASAFVLSLSLGAAGADFGIICGVEEDMTDLREAEDDLSNAAKQSSRKYGIMNDIKKLESRW